MEPRQEKKGYLVLVIISLLILILSFSVLVFIEMKNPSYGIIKRIGIAKNVIFNRNWLKTYTDHNTMLKEVEEKEVELKSINREIRTKKNILNDIDYLIDSRVPILKKKVELLNSKVKTLDHKLSSYNKK